MLLSAFIQFVVHAGFIFKFHEIAFNSWELIWYQISSFVTFYVSVGVVGFFLISNVLEMFTFG